MADEPSPVEREMERLEPLAEHLVPLSGRIQRDFGNVLDAMDAEAHADQVMQEEFQKRPDALEANVDLTALRQVDPTFDEHQFIAIAREIFEQVHAARFKRDAKVGANELTPEEESALEAAIAQDQAHTRLHCYPGIEVEDARIAAAAVDAGKEVVTVHFVVKGEELERDAGTLAIVSGSEDVHQWDETWTLVRDPAVDASPVDHSMTLMQERWYFDHLGWLVSSIQTTTGPSPLTPD